MVNHYSRFFCMSSAFFFVCRCVQCRLLCFTAGFVGSWFGIRSVWGWTSVVCRCQQSMSFRGEYYSHWQMSAIRVGG